MWFGVVSLFPAFFEGLKQYGVIGRAISEEKANLDFFNPRDYAHDKHKQVDDKPYGGGGGMLMSCLPIQMALEAGLHQAKEDKPKVVFFSPAGRLLTQNVVESYSHHQELILVSGCYEGIDERVVKHYADDEISIGDYVLSGGELPIMVFINAVLRLREGVLGNSSSPKRDSFMDGLLEAPHYTRPETMYGMRVPDALLGGNHAEIEKWRRQQSLGRTWLRRPDLLSRADVSEEDKRLLKEFIENINKEKQK